MANSKWLNSLTLIALVAAGALCSCGSRQDRASEAFEQYQAATASGDLPLVRRALSKLVAADDTVAEYWIELGKVQLQLGDHGAAHDAFVRAHELDRANASVLAILTQISLRSGNLALAEQRARQLELVAPEDPAVRLTLGYVALRRADYDEANKQADLLLVTAPFDSSAKVLRARILLQTGKPQEAVVLLREQVRLQPSDQASLRALQSIYEFQEMWSDAAWAARSLLTWLPADQELRARLVESELRAGRISEASQVTLEGLTKATPDEIEILLNPWVVVGVQREIADAAFQLGRVATGDRRVALARFLALADRPQQVIELTREAATVPIRPGNGIPNALYGWALAKTGQPVLGLERVTEVIASDSSNADALRARAELRTAFGATRLAIEDAQRLVTLNRGSPQDRLLLARIYLSAYRPEDARRTLWEAFREIPADRSIYDALRTLVQRAEGPQASSRLAKEFEDQRSYRMARSFA